VNLDDFAGADPIFVDANVFTYSALGMMTYQESCTEFLLPLLQFRGERKDWTARGG
jgi:hypothetical protein